MQLFRLDLFGYVNTIFIICTSERDLERIKSDLILGL